MASSHFENKKSTTEVDQPLKIGCHRGCGWKQAAGDREAVGPQGQCWQHMSTECRGVGQRKYTVRKYQVEQTRGLLSLLSKQEFLPSEWQEHCPREPDRELQRQDNPGREWTQNWWRRRLAWLHYWLISARMPAPLVSHGGFVRWVSCASQASHSLWSPPFPESHALFTSWLRI